MPRCVVLCAALLLLATTAEGQGSRDLAVLNVLKRSDTSLVHALVWHRVQVTDELDLVLALGSPRVWPFDDQRARQWWGEQRKLGLFLQDRSQPSRVFTLTSAPGIDDCHAGIVRAAATDTVISCQGEKSETRPNQKFVYDVRAKRLVSRFSYDPFVSNRITLKGPDAARLTAANDTLEVTLDFVVNRTPAFKVVGRTKRAPPPYQLSSEPEPRLRSLSPRFGPSRAFRLAAAGDGVEGIDMGASCSDTEILVVETHGSRERLHRIPRKGPDCHRIGPWQLEGNDLWFGTTYYAGESGTGVGGFGYFDAMTKGFRVIPSPELSRWSTSAIFVRPDAVWLALASYWEYGNETGGVVRYDRAANTFKRFEIGPAIGKQFAMIGDRLLIATDKGVVVLHDDDVRSYFVDQTSDGRLRVVEGSGNRPQE